MDKIDKLFSEYKKDILANENFEEEVFFKIKKRKIKRKIYYYIPVFISLIMGFYLLFFTNIMDKEKTVYAKSNHKKTEVEKESSSKSVYEVMYFSTFDRDTQYVVEYVDGSKNDKNKKGRPL